MTETGTHRGSSGLAWWMRIVGTFYLILALLNSPIGAVRLIVADYAGAGGTATEALVDWHFVWAVDIGLVGAFLIYASRRPERFRILVWLVIAQELLRGIAMDAYFLTRGFYDERVYLGFIVVHTLIIGTGLYLVPRAPREPPAAEGT